MSHQPVMPRPASGRETSRTWRRAPVPVAARRRGRVPSRGLAAPARRREQHVCGVPDEGDRGQGLRVRVVDASRSPVSVVVRKPKAAASPGRANVSRRAAACSGRARNCVCPVARRTGEVGGGRERLDDRPSLLPHEREGDERPPRQGRVTEAPRCAGMNRAGRRTSGGGGEAARPAGRRGRGAARAGGGARSGR